MVFDEFSQSDVYRSDDVSVLAVATVLAHKELAVAWFVVGTDMPADRASLARVVRIHYVRHLKTIIQGLQQKIDELASQGSNVTKVKVSDADKYMLENDDLKRQIQLLQEELRACDELIAKLLEETEAERVEPFETPVHIAHFGLRGNAFVSERAKYDVQVTFFDPLDEHVDFGDFEDVVYNEC